jgi:uncharacterized protein
MSLNGRPPNQDGPYEEVLLSFDRFEWDESKCELNIERHGIDFRGAVRIFDGFILRTRSDRKGEIRWLAIGLRNDEVISVVYTERSETCRIISARRARRKERAAYRELYAGGA